MTDDIIITGNWTPCSNVQDSGRAGNLLILFTKPHCPACDYIKSKMSPAAYIQLPGSLLKGGTEDWTDYCLAEILADLTLNDWDSELPVAFDIVTRRTTQYADLCTTIGVPVMECNDGQCKLETELGRDVHVDSESPSTTE